MKEKGRWISLALLLFLILTTAVSCQKGNAGTQEESSSAEETAETIETENAGLSFPYELEDGKLVINALFQSSVENPDYGNEIGEDIASLEIVNQSEQYCISAEITAVMEDGREISFAASDIPAGKTVWVFALDNQSVEQESACMEIKGTAVFGEASMLEEEISCSVDDTTITLQNLTEQELTGLSVRCHCLFEEAYFGGVTYCYPVEAIPAGGTVTVEADDCYMGTAEVVSIEKEE